MPWNKEVQVNREEATKLTCQLIDAGHAQVHTASPVFTRGTLKLLDKVVDALCATAGAVSIEDLQEILELSSWG